MRDPVKPYRLNMAGIRRRRGARLTVSLCAIQSCSGPSRASEGLGLITTGTTDSRLGLLPWYVLDVSNAI
jgi:hypothetical protein